MHINVLGDDFDIEKKQIRFNFRTYLFKKPKTIVNLIDKREAYTQPLQRMLYDGLI